MLREPTSASEKAESTALQEAHTLARVLRREFGVGFALFEAATGRCLKAGDGAIPPLTPERIAACTVSNRALVTRLDAGHLHMMVPIRGRQTAYLAVGVTPSHGSAADVSELADHAEQAMLSQWLTAFSARLHQAASPMRGPHAGKGAAASESSRWLPCLEQLIRDLGDPDAATDLPQRLLSTMSLLIPAQGAAWINMGRRPNVWVGGDLGLNKAQADHLGSELHARRDGWKDGILIWDRGTGGPTLQAPAHILNLLAIIVEDPGNASLVLLANRKGRRRFGRSDAQILRPVRALLRNQVVHGRKLCTARRLFVGAVRALTTALDARDPLTFGHSERVAKLAVGIGRELGLSSPALDELYLAALLHDVGKIGIPDRLLNKTTALTTGEWQQVQRHVSIGRWILSDLKQVASLVYCALYHHERVDGQGYPDGLTGASIPLLARIVAVADGYDAMSSRRPYRESISAEDVESVLLRGKGTQWDPDAVEALLRFLRTPERWSNPIEGDPLERAAIRLLQSDVCEGEAIEVQ